MSNEDKEKEKAKEKKKLQVRSVAARAMFHEFFSEVAKSAFYVNESAKKISIGFDRDDGFVIEVSLSTAWLSVWLESFGDLAQKIIAGASAEEVQGFDCEAMRIKQIALFTVEGGVLKRCDRRIRKIRIPDGVKTIGSKAFSYCEHLKSVHISKSVENIGEQAFFRCTALEKITVEAESEHFCAVANTLYTKDLSTLIFNPPLAEPTIVDGVKRIERYAFAFSALAKKIELPKSVEEIGRSAFMDCSALSCVVLNEGLRELPVMAFNSCHSLKEVIIPSTVEVLHDSAFYSCPFLEKIILRGNTKIEPNAFSYCNKQLQVVKA